MKTVTSAFESILGTSYSRVVIKSGYQLEKQIGQGAFGDVFLFFFFSFSSWSRIKIHN